MFNSSFSVIKCTLIAFLLMSGHAKSQNTWDGSSVNTCTTNGSVGIGTTSPNSKLQINNSNLVTGVNIANVNTLTGTQYGLYNYNNLSGTSGTKYSFFNSGVYNTTGQTFGIYNTLSSNGAGTAYGSYFRVTGTSTSTKYAIYALVPTGTTGTTYGIYSEATGTGNRSGYFKGDLEAFGNFILSSNNQSRFVFHTSWASGALGEQWLQIAPNSTSGGYDWNFNNSLIFFNSGLLQKSTSTDALAFSIKRTDLNKDVFRVYGNGKVYVTEVNVLPIGTFPDYVFDENYKLMSLYELRAYIENNKHLPNMPTASNVAENGMNVGETTRILVEKVEELTLYLIEQQKQLDEQKALIEEQKQLLLQFQTR